MEARVRVVGLKELIRELRRVDREIPKRLTTFMQPIGRRVALQSQAQARSLGSVHSHVASGISGGATGGRAYVSLNSGRQPAILGAEFGGGRRRTTRQFPPWRGSGSNAGYMVLPTIWDQHDDILREIEDTVFDLLETL